MSQVGSELNADNLTMISKSDAANPLKTFKMDTNTELMAGYTGRQPDQMNEFGGNVSASVEGTKMSDNEAFMAYMSKAEGCDDDED